MPVVPRRRAALSLALVAALTAAVSCTHDRGPTNVLLIVIDSLRADEVDASAATDSGMPFVSGLAARGLWYEQAYAPTSWTLPSVASLFTARYPSEHQVNWWGHKIPPEDATLAEVLRAGGYVTGGRSAHDAVGAKHGLERGFDDLQTVGEPKLLRSPDATQVNAAALLWLDSLRPRKKPFFLYLHYMDVHFPYRPHAGITAPRSPEVGRGDIELSADASRGSLAEAAERATLWNFTPAERRRLRQLYDGEARYVDGKLAELFAQLEKRDLLRDTLVVITADHGEEFGEHDIFGHATTLYRTVLHVPLVVVPPGDSPPRRIAAPVGVGGLAPTLLRALGLPAQESFHIPAFPMSGAGGESRDVFSELIDTHSLSLRLHAQAVTSATARLLVTPQGDELFFDDPAEIAPRAAGPQAVELRAFLTATRQGMAAGENGGEIELDAQTRERLRNLGYETDK